MICARYHDTDKKKRSRENITTAHETTPPSLIPENSAPQCPVGHEVRCTCTYARDKTLLSCHFNILLHAHHVRILRSTRALCTPRTCTIFPPHTDSLALHMTLQDFAILLHSSPLLCTENYLVTTSRAFSHSLGVSFLSGRSSQHCISPPSVPNCTCSLRCNYGSALQAAIGGRCSRIQWCLMPDW